MTLSTPKMISSIFSSSAKNPSIKPPQKTKKPQKIGPKSSKPKSTNSKDSNPCVPNLKPSLWNGHSTVYSEKIQNQKTQNLKSTSNQHQSKSKRYLINYVKDIKLKTLYFFKWCKFIEYGKSIKKLRLKEIDDLRKSLTFNMYAVKFSYFHNWRRQARQNASNRQKFNQIQKTSQRDLFRNTVNSFYSLFGTFLII